MGGNPHLCARGGAPGRGRPSRQWLPVVLYSPGVGDPRSFGSTLCDELASRGYAVVTIDHTYEAPAVEFPDGRLARSVLATELAKAQKSGRITALLKKVSGVRVADTRFVLDELAEQGAASPLPPASGGRWICMPSECSDSRPAGSRRRRRCMTTGGSRPR